MKSLRISISDIRARLVGLTPAPDAEARMASLGSMTAEERHASALADPDAPPAVAEKLYAARMRRRARLETEDSAKPVRVTR